MRANERRPAGAASEACGPESSLPDPVDDRTDDTIPTLAAMTPHARVIALAYFEAGRAEGIEAGRRQLEDEWRGTYEVSAAVARQVAQRGSFDELAERRGQPERAARQRAILAERGVIA